MVCWACVISIVMIKGVPESTKENNEKEKSFQNGLARRERQGDLLFPEKSRGRHNPLCVDCQGQKPKCAIKPGNYSNLCACMSQKVS